MNRDTYAMALRIRSSPRTPHTTKRRRHETIVHVQPQPNICNVCPRDIMRQEGFSRKCAEVTDGDRRDDGGLDAGGGGGKRGVVGE